MTSPDRDRDVDRLLKSTRLQPPAAAAGVCLDAETLAAWTDGTLSSDERIAAERHAADCARCQATLAAMVRTAPLHDAAPSRWSVRRVMQWAVPLAAAAAVALWFAVDRDTVAPRPSEPVLHSPAETAAPAANAAVPPPAPSSSKPSAPPVTSPALADARNARDRGARESQRESPKKTRTDAPAATEADARQQRVAAAAPVEAPVQQTPPPPSQQTAAASAPQQAAPPPSQQQGPPPPSQQAAPATTTGSAPPQVPPLPVAEAVAVAPPAAKPTAVSDLASARAATQKSVTRSERQMRAAWIEVASPDPLAKWRFASGVVERSADSGVTWTRESTGTTSPIVAGSSPSPSVCWLVGRAGVVLRFTTARGWQRIDVPGAPDLAAVEAKDAENATVTLANGRRLTTTNGGGAWH